jgi:transcriptional regulator with XRE-family HTH domain
MHSPTIYELESAPSDGMAVEFFQPLMADRIRRVMARRRTNAAALARTAHLGSTAVYDILRRKNRNPSRAVLESIARAADVNVDYLLGNTDNMEVRRGDALGDKAAVLPIPVIGLAEAGAYRAAMLTFDLDEHELPTINAPLPKHHPEGRRFALQVIGHSMDAARPAPIAHGMYALCVDLASAGLGIESGRIYAVQRTLDGGQTWECIIKRCMVYADRIELVSESTHKDDPRHQPIVINRRAKGNDLLDTREIKAIGLVYGAMSSFED